MAFITLHEVHNVMTFAQLTVIVWHSLHDKTIRLNIIHIKMHLQMII